VQAQLEQLALNAWCTPARVVAAHHPDQIPNPLRHAGPTWLAAADSPRPEPAKAFTMPGDNCVSLDDHQDGFPVAPRVVAARQGFPVVAGPKSFSTGAGHGEQALLRRPTEQNESRSTSMIAGRSEYFGEAICGSRKCWFDGLRWRAGGAIRGHRTTVRLPIIDALTCVGAHSYWLRFFQRIGGHRRCFFAGLPRLGLCCSGKRSRAETTSSTSLS
jgi:hypothetical protein